MPNTEGTRFPRTLLSVRRLPPLGLDAFMLASPSDGLAGRSAAGRFCGTTRSRSIDASSGADLTERKESVGDVARGVPLVAFWRAILKSVANAFEEPAAEPEHADSRQPPPGEGSGTASETPAADVLEARSHEGERSDIEVSSEMSSDERELDTGLRRSTWLTETRRFDETRDVLTRHETF